MSCFRPLQAVRIDCLDNPVRILSGVQALALRDSVPLFGVPCGRCVGCRLDYSRGWAIRCMHEADLYEFNSFVTLTYNDYHNNLRGGSLCYRDVQLFIKRLRKAISDCPSKYGFLFDPGSNLRFFMCGEYGSRTFRPHFHILFFNLDFSDKVLHSKRLGYSLFTSESLSHFWSDPDTGDSYGFAVTGSVTSQSAGYVSRYSVKKALSADELVYFNSVTGEFLAPEKTNMSRRPGIAHEWFKLYSKSVYSLDLSSDNVVMRNGLRFKPPRYYDSLLEASDPSLFSVIKQRRVDQASTPASLANNTVERLIVREHVKLSKVDLLHRVL